MSSESKRPLQLLIILAGCVLSCAIASHIAVSWLRISVTYGGYHHYGTSGKEAHTILHGSSLAYDGIDWGLVSENMGEPIESWATPGSSPAEWEVMHRRSPKATFAFIVVSPYDLNENFLCESRANIVSLWQAVADLVKADSEWTFCKRVISQYPMSIVRTIFPTVGRADGVMTGIRYKLHRILRGSSNASAGDAPKFGSTGSSEVTEKLSEWPAARLQRRLVLMRSSCQGRHSFNGPKKMSLERLLKSADIQGNVVLIVMPVSPIYRKEFINAQINSDFESQLSSLQAICSRSTLIRLDNLKELQDSAMFSDLVHLNMFGQRIATAALLERLETGVAKK